MPRNAMSLRITAVALACLATLLAAASPALAADPVLRLQAFAVNMSGVGRANAQTLQIVIERWTTDDERTKLLSTLVEKGTDKLMDKLQDIRPRAGYIRTNTSLGWDIQYARQTDLPSGGQRIVFATDRPISFREAANSPRSKDYDFMVCEVRLGADGKGQGKLAVATKITYDKEKKTIELENYGQEPVRLTEVKIEK